MQNRLRDRLRDPIWQFVGALAGFIAIIFTVLVFLTEKLGMHCLFIRMGWIIFAVLIIFFFLIFIGPIAPTATVRVKVEAFVFSTRSFFRSSWGKRMLSFFLLLGLVILEYIKLELLLWHVTLLAFSFQLLFWLGLVFQIAHYIFDRRASERLDRTQPTLDLEEAMVASRFICLPLGDGPSRIFHGPSPCVLPVCFEKPRSSEHIYVVVGRHSSDETDHIITEPRLATPNISSEQLKKTPRWYILTSDKPLKSVTFKNGPKVENFTMVQVEEFRQMGIWNDSGPVIVPANLSRAYALAITEQLGPSTWFVSIDGQEFTFDETLGCHFAEFVLQTGQQHTLSLGYKRGGLGIACALFAF